MKACDITSTREHTVDLSAEQPVVCSESGPGYWMPGFGCLRAEGENRPSRPGHLICFAQNQRNEVRNPGDHTGALAAELGMKQQSCLVYTLQGNGIDRANTARCNGCGWKSDVCYTLNTIDRHAVCYPDSALSGAKRQSAGKRNSDSVDRIAYGGERAETLDASYYKGPGARNGREREFIAEKRQGRKYIVRRLTTTECARLQGFPDCWAIPVCKGSFTDGEAAFWEQVRKTHADANGRRYRPYARREQLVRWYNRLHTDSSEYRLYGNGIALPCAAFVLRDIAAVLKEDDFCG